MVSLLLVGVAEGGGPGVWLRPRMTPRMTSVAKTHARAMVTTLIKSPKWVNAAWVVLVPADPGPGLGRKGHRQGFRTGCEWPVTGRRIP